MFLLQEPPKKDKKDEEEEEEKPPSHLNLIWDETEVANGDYDVLKEACVGNDYNLWSKGAPKCEYSSSTLKMAMKKTLATMASIEISLEKGKDNGKDLTTVKSTTSMDLTQKILGYLKLDYYVVEDLKKMKANITVFELYKITQLREQLHEALQHIQGS